ncbi:MAG: CCA tRNA nucleotidyltransferase [Planctomycetia bacterium]|nr:CCA tRNA nucleotidyltransferase [Planctomycetia bacterium]
MFALSVLTRLRDAGYCAYWAGGCVRDLLLRITPHDYDVATDASPDHVRKLFRRTIAVGAQFGVIEILGQEPGIHVQVATFRSDGHYSDGRHPDSVRYGTPEEDAKRRDFTINGLFFDPTRDEVIDFVGGQLDLNRKLVRAIGDPVQRFEEDKLRMLRAVRFVSRLGFALEEQTADAIKLMHPDLKQVSAERITDELKKMLLYPARQIALNYLMKLRLLPTLLPTLVDIEQAEETFPGVLVSQLPGESSFPLCWAAVLLDLQRAFRAEMQITHQELFGTFGREFRLSQAEIAQVDFLIRSLEKMHHAASMPWAELKPILAHADVADLLSLVEADVKGRGISTQGLDYCREHLRHWTREQLQPAPLVTGEDLIQLGVTKGPRFKVLLDAVRDAQLNEEINNRQDALSLLEKLAKRVNSSDDVSPI